MKYCCNLMTAQYFAAAKCLHRAALNVHTSASQRARLFFALIGAAAELAVGAQMNLLWLKTSRASIVLTLRPAPPSTASIMDTCPEITLYKRVHVLQVYACQTSRLPYPEEWRLSLDIIIPQMHLPAAWQEAPAHIPLALCLPAGVAGSCCQLCMCLLLCCRLGWYGL